eukprot:gene535-3856_t
MVAVLTEQCMVKSYLQWLQDADFTTKCSLCQQELNNGEDTVRLPCFEYIYTHDSNLSESDFKCPCCQMTMMPDEHNASPIASEARKVLIELFQQRPNSKVESVVSIPATIGNSSIAPTSGTIDNSSSLSSKRRDAILLNRDTKRAGKHSGEDDSSFSSNQFDTDANKYARRPANQWFAQVVGNRFPARKVKTEPSLPRAVILLLLFVLAMFTVIHLMTRTRPIMENDPFLDPQMNPHIRNDGSR